MEKNNFPQVDISDVRRKYSLVDVSRLEFKEPSNSDELQSREFYGDEETIEGLKKLDLRKRPFRIPNSNGA